MQSRSRAMWKAYFVFTLVLALTAAAAAPVPAANDMAPYVAAPTFLSTAVPPLVTILFDNSGSMNQMAYWEEAVTHEEGDPWWQYDITPSTPYNPNRNYYGYFVAGTPGNRVYYTYTSNTFVRSATGEWEGNFLNWLTMRRVDVARKVLVGGKATSRTGGGNTTLIGEDPAQWGRSYRCKLDGSIMAAYTPFDDGADRYVGVADGYVYVSKDLDTNPFEKWDYKYYIKVKRDSSYADEADDFLDGNIAGVMQKVGDKAYWGLEFFRYGTGGDDNGGYMKNRVGHPNLVSLYTNIENEAMQNWTPLAESLYVAMQYYRQQAIESPYTDDYSPGYQINDTWDPFIQGGATFPCSKGFVLIFTDGASTQDGLIPDYLRDFDGDGHDPDSRGDYYSGGTDYLDDVALYARTHDLRPDLEGEQHLETFVVYAFGNEPQARRLLKDTARNGGFIDRDGDNLPDPASGSINLGTQSVTNVDYTNPPSDDSWSEWWADKRTDSNGHAMPDTYFEAQDGFELERQLIRAITKILERASSGTAVSVLATSGEGEGTLYQAYFKPKYSTATEEVYWTGYLQGLWVDALGNLREDWTSSSNHAPDNKLDLTVDPIVSFFFDQANGETKFERILVDSNHPYGDASTAATYSMSELSPMWEAGEKLADRSPASRSIYTFVDIDADGVVDGSGSLDSNEFISFHTSNASKLKPYLDLADDPFTAEVDFSYLGSSESDRVNNLINYIRGSDTGLTGTTNVRNRTADSKVWKLGDIIHSTPTPIGRPVDNYDIIYGDSTYAEFYRRHQNRETVVYVGANDGMLHAFLAGVFHPGPVKSGLLAGNGAYFTRDPADEANKYASLGSDWAGQEIWAYIPQNLLPHLKWLADPDYKNANHVYYVDLKPRIFDARIYEGADAASHPLNSLWSSMSAAQKADRPHGWATLLIGGMRFGGGDIDVTGDFDYDSGTADTTRTFSSAYFCIDITDPLHPIPLWERNSDLLPGLGFTVSFPAVVKVDDKTIDTTTDPDTVTTKRHWFLLLGSGPTWPHYDGTSGQSARLFVVDLATGRTDISSNKGRIFTKTTNAKGTSTGTTLPANGFMGSPVAVDYGLDYSVNVAYIGETHESGGSYDGGLYRLLIPTSTGTVDGNPVTLYDPDTDNWTFSHVFDADFGITASPGAAVAVSGGEVVSDALWVYFGTGRYLATADKTDTSQQYLYALKDPLFNLDLTSSQQDTLLGAEPHTKASLFDATGVKVFTDGSISGTSEATTFDGLKLKQNYGDAIELGWYRSLEISGERVINKPSVLGGIVLAPTFVPNSDVCAFGGDSYLYALYFETGTAYKESVIGLADDAAAPTGEKRVVDKTNLGVGLASSLGIHVGREEGAKGFIQQSTGTVTEIDLSPALAIKSGFVSWRER